MRISPGYSTEDWAKLDFAKEECWQKAVDIFEDRIKGRFLSFVEYIAHKEFAGFFIMAIDCLLIETLQQFIEGVEETPDRQSRRYFMKFLQESSFKDYFDEHKAKLFYEQIRCGILHRAEIKKSSRISIRKDVPLVDYTADNDGLVINRRLFHRQMVHAFEAYVSDLRDPRSTELRDKFRKKMNYICRVPVEES